MTAEQGSLAAGRGAPRPRGPRLKRTRRAAALRWPRGSRTSRRSPCPRRRRRRRPGPPGGGSRARCRRRPRA